MSGSQTQNELKRGTFGRILVDGSSGSSNRVIKELALLQQHDGKRFLAQNNVMEVAMSMACKLGRVKGVVAYDLAYANKDRKSADYTLCIVQERAADGDLSKYLAKTPQAARMQRLRQVVGDMVHAVHDLHNHGIAHCDLKPQNMLVMADGRIKLIDMGSSKLHARGGRFMKSICNATTHVFAPPEYFQDGPIDVCLLDAYSLGMVIHNYMYNEYISSEYDYDVIRNKHISGHIADKIKGAKPPDDLLPQDAWIFDAMKALLHPDPGLRLTVEEMHHLLCLKGACPALAAAQREVRIVLDAASGATEGWNGARAVGMRSILGMSAALGDVHHLFPLAANIADRYFEKQGRSRSRKADHTAACVAIASCIVAPPKPHPSLADTAAVDAIVDVMNTLGGHLHSETCATILEMRGRELASFEQETILQAVVDAEGQVMRAADLCDAYADNLRHLENDSFDELMAWMPRAAH